MPIKLIIKEKQPEVYKKLINFQYGIKSEDEYLTEEDFKKMMRHDSYRRVNGVIRQVRHE